MQDSGTAAGLRGIDSVDGTVAWASGTGGTVLKTTDRGAHWQKCAVPDGDKDGATLDFRGVQAWDAQTAIVMASGPGEKSRLYKTVDGCKTWKLLFVNPDTPEGFFDSFHLMIEQRLLSEDEGFGLLMGDPVQGELSIFETRDGGNTWRRLHDPLLKVKGAAFAASNQCIRSMNATNDFVIGGALESTHLRLNYSGTYWLNDNSPITRTWYRKRLPIASGAESAGPFAIGARAELKYASDGNTVLNIMFHGIAVGGDYTKPNESTGTAAFSTTGSEHWTASATPPHGYRSTVQWSDSLKLWITAGTNGSDISRDDGKTWQPLDNGNWNALSLPFIVGPNGRIGRLDAAALPASR